MQLYARRHFFFPPLNIEEYNDRVTAVVRCEAQVCDLPISCRYGRFFIFKKKMSILEVLKHVTFFDYVYIIFTLKMHVLQVCFVCPGCHSILLKLEECCLLSFPSNCFI